MKPSAASLPFEQAAVNRFAFIVHPLDVDFIHQHPHYRWTKYLPDPLVECIAAWFPPIALSRITGGQSQLTGQRIEGYLYSLGLTPHQMLRHKPEFTYRRINHAARMAARRGVRIIGLGAFTSVVGDAGITVAKRSEIAVTSGNSLTAAITLETAKLALIQMGCSDIRMIKAMVVGATGSIGSVCARLLARLSIDVVCVSLEAQKLADLQRKIQQETPEARVSTSTQPAELVRECDLIITATTAIGQKVLDISLCKPGVVICDVARPPNITSTEAAQRKDVLVVESGEVVIPGDINFGYDIGLPAHTTYACLAETALLAMEGRFENFSLGRDISIVKVGEIFQLFMKHQFKIASLRSFGLEVTEEVLAEKRELAKYLQSISPLTINHFVPTTLSVE